MRKSSIDEKNKHEDLSSPPWKEFTNFKHCNETPASSKGASKFSHFTGVNSSDSFSDDLNLGPKFQQEFEELEILG